MSDDLRARLSECCGVQIDSDRRFCQKCGWEARVEAASALAIPLIEKEKNDDDDLSRVDS